MVYVEKNLLKQAIVTGALQRTLSDAQKDINHLLEQEPLLFDANESLFEKNKSLHLIIDILNTIEEKSVAIIVNAFCNELDSRRDNRKLSQKRADSLAHYIDEVYAPLFITAIGYGEEFSSSDGNGTQKSSRIEIEIKRVVEEPLN